MIIKNRALFVGFSTVFMLSSNNGSFYCLIQDTPVAGMDVIPTGDVQLVQPLAAAVSAVPVSLWIIT